MITIKMKTTLVITLSFLFVLFLLQIITDRNPHSKEERLANISLQNSAKKIKSKFSIEPVGSGITMPGGPIRGLFLAFESRKSLSKEELRKLLIATAQIMVEEVKNDEEIKPFLHANSFTIANVQIIIYNHYENGSRLFNPQIGSAQFSKGNLDYLIIDTEDGNSNYSFIVETYEEALKALEEGSS